ncbi:MAG TPA: CcmD family protein [Dongiaceae bacterium]|nr:CcmD family protein [Dongiaceae bacterium]
MIFIDDLAGQAAGLLSVAGHCLGGLLGAGIQAAGEGAATAFEAADQPLAVARRLQFLSWAYTAVWIILAAYLLLLSTRQRRLEKLVRQLRDRISPPGPTLRP